MTLISTQFIQYVGVWCIWSTNDNCLTLENHPLGIVGILIPQIHPLKLIYPFINQRKLNQTILPIHICMAQGPRLRPALYYNHRISMKIVIWRPGSDHLWAAYLDHDGSTVKMVPKVSSIAHAKSSYILFYFPTCPVVVGLCAVMACWGMAFEDWCSRAIAGQLCSIQFRKSRLIIGGQYCLDRYEWNSMLEQECREGYLSFLNE